MLRRGWFPRGEGQGCPVIRWLVPDLAVVACGAGRADRTRRLEAFLRRNLALRDVPGLRRSGSTACGRPARLPQRYVTKERCRAGFGWRAGADLCRVAPGARHRRRPVSAIANAACRQRADAAGPRPNLEFQLRGGANAKPPAVVVGRP